MITRPPPHMQAERPLRPLPSLRFFPPDPTPSTSRFRSWGQEGRGPGGAHKVSRGGARQFSDGRKKIYAVFDEFNVFASSAVVDLIGKTRSFGFNVLIGTQSPSDLERAGGGALLEQVVENCNSYIIHRQNSALNAEKLASVIGTDDSYELTYQVQERGIFFTGRTGLGSMRQTREFIIHPDEIKRLGTGEAILVQKTSGFRVVKVKVRRNGI